VYHERTRDSLARALRRLPLGPGGVTALVVTNSLDYLTAISVLTRRGLRIPEDVSVVARNDDTFMRALLPEPTRYHASPPALARSLFRLLRAVIDGNAPTRPQVRIMPDFIAGESLAAAPEGAPR
jgi:LacI family transcriptional regulator